MERFLLVVAIIVALSVQSSVQRELTKDDFVDACRSVLSRSDDECKNALWRKFSSPRRGKYDDFFDDIGYRPHAMLVSHGTFLRTLFWTSSGCNETPDIVRELGKMEDEILHSGNLAPAHFVHVIESKIREKQKSDILGQLSSWMALNSRGTVLWLTAGSPSFFPAPYHGTKSTWETREVVNLPEETVDHVVILHQPCYSSDQDLALIEQAGGCTDNDSITRLFNTSKLPEHLANKFICCDLQPYKDNTHSADDIASGIIHTVKGILDAADSGK